MSTVNVNRVVDASGGVLAPISSVMRNRIINGAMTITQRGTSAVTTDGAFPVDRFRYFYGNSGAYSSQQSSTAPAGFVNSIYFTTTTASGALGATQQMVLNQQIEGFNVADLNWGTANAKTVTLSFWVQSSLTGTFGGSLRNNAENRSYPFTYTIATANTWTQASVTIPGDTSGTWLTNNSTGISLCFGLGVGSTLSGTAGAWAGSDFRSATGAVSVIGTLNATFYITGVQLEVGTQATSFEYRQVTNELSLCQRYYWRWVSVDAFAGGATGNADNTNSANAVVKLPVTMRAQPTTSYSTLRIADGGANPAATSITATRNSYDAMSIYFGATANNLVLGRGVVIQANNSTTAFIDASAEL